MVSLRIDYFSFTLMILTYFLGFIFALIAVFQARTPQGTMAWVLGLLFVPFLAIPLFLLFGKKNFDEYAKLSETLFPFKEKIEQALLNFRIHPPPDSLGQFLMKVETQYFEGNSIELLVDGKEVFDEMILSISSAQKYIFLQMYIFRADVIGREFIDTLIRQAQRGVKIYILVERLGFHFSRTHIKEMKKFGIKISKFSPVHTNILHFNFRNHRKLLITDGKSGFYGGINIGDDYLGKYPSIGFWRDTNVKIHGPAVYASQMEFLKDWFWSTSETIDFEYTSPEKCGNSHVMIVNSDPSDEDHKNLLLHIQLINSGKRRIWIANPYLIPPQGIIDALVIACKRGVEVKILVPNESDNFFVKMASEAFLEKFWKSGIHIYKYKKGMMHQKVVLLDEDCAMIGSSNLDYRSMYINFENSVITTNPEFLLELDLCFRHDFENSEEVQLEHFKNIKFHTKLFSRFANALSPIL